MIIYVTKLAQFARNSKRMSNYFAVKPKSCQQSAMMSAMAEKRAVMTDNIFAGCEMVISWLETMV